MALPHGLQKDLPAHHQGFFIGQKQALACTGCCQARRQARRAHNGGHDRIHIRMRGNGNQAFFCCQNFRLQRMCLALLAQQICMRRRSHHRIAGLVLPAQSQHFFDLGRGADGKQAKTFRMTRHHIQRAGAD